MGTLLQGMRRRWLAGLAALAVAGGVVAAVLILAEGPEGGAAPASRGLDLAAAIEAVETAAGAAAFGRPTDPFVLSLPADHGAHPGARAETWALTMHLEDDRGRATGLQVALSRYGIRPAGEGDDAWDLAALWRGHVALLRADAAAVGEERFGRGALGAAGADGADGAAAGGAVWIDDWRLGHYGDGHLTLAASAGTAGIDLVLSPAKPALATGGGEVLRGFALPRMAVAGRIGHRDGTEGARHAVQGVAWLDRLWGAVPVPGGAVAYDRLIVHLDDGWDLSLLRTRRRDGRGIAALDGLVVDPQGRSSPLAEDVTMEVAARWGPGDEPVYPVAWRIAGPGLALDVTPVIEDQR
ncbi:MAG: lipocalin-like domain-containing protein, partial [Pseudomonadota bacterium]